MALTYIGTRDRSIKATASEAILRGICPDGGLYIPEEIPKMEKSLEELGKLNYQELAYEVLSKFLDFTEEELKVICQPLDFFGFNCYNASNYEEYMGPNPAVTPGMPRTAMDWPITPDALYWAARFLTERYHLPIIVTENGMANIDFVMSDGAVHDPQRIDFVKRYLAGLQRAVDENIPVTGYLYWSIMDNFEWAEGYDKRFGLVYVDYQTQQRIPKDSFYWYADVIKNNRIS